MKLKDLKHGDYFKFKDPHYTSLYVLAEDHGTPIIFSLTNFRTHSYVKYLEWEVEIQKCYIGYMVTFNGQKL